MTTEEFLNIKVVLIGETNVGKTSIILRYAANTFKNELMTTSGASFVSKSVTINDKCIKFEIWDTACQEKFRAVTRIFYQNAKVCILVYDITKRESFTELKNFWVNEIQNNIQKDASKIIYIIFKIYIYIVLALVGNKTDLYEQEVVSYDEGLELAKNINAIYQRTSAKEQSGGVDELFNNIGKKILDPSYEIVSNMTREERRKKGEKLLKQQIKTENPKSRCCS